MYAFLFLGMETDLDRDLKQFCFSLIQPEVYVPSMIDSRAHVFGWRRHEPSFLGNAVRTSTQYYLVSLRAAPLVITPFVVQKAPVEPSSHLCCNPISYVASLLLETTHELYIGGEQMPPLRLVCFELKYCIGLTSLCENWSPC